MKKALFSLILLLAATAASHAQSSVSLIWQYFLSPSTQLSILGPNGVTPLAGAAASNSGTGFVIQLGYYSQASDSDPFAGTWVPVFGPGSTGTNDLFTNAGMGSGVSSATGTDDSFVLSGTITSTDPNSEAGIPSAGTIMSIRYYNANSLGAATYFGAVSDVDGVNNTWSWISPSSIPETGMSFNFYDTGVVYEGLSSGTGVISGTLENDPVTNIAFNAVPEPGTLYLAATALALGATVLRRRRK